ncbi:hypothetical protein GGF37_000815 [Kickxella alabastrina]|nr:hypothetical protein GGF37_000815 [Kickxella alabastrina]
MPLTVQYSVIDDLFITMGEALPFWKGKFVSVKYDDEPLVIALSDKNFTTSENALYKTKDLVVNVKPNDVFFKSYEVLAGLVNSKIRDGLLGPDSEKIFLKMDSSKPISFRIKIKSFSRFYDKNNQRMEDKDVPGEGKGSFSVKVNGVFITDKKITVSMNLMDAVIHSFDVDQDTKPNLDFSKLRISA